MKLRNTVLVGALALGLIVTTGMPAYAYDQASGSTTCSGTRTVSGFGTQNDTVRHWYYAAGVMKEHTPVAIGPYYFWRSYSSTQSTSWKVETFGSFESGKAKGASCY